MCNSKTRVISQNIAKFCRLDVSFIFVFSHEQNNNSVK